MVIYAQRVRQHMTALGVASATPAQPGFSGSGMPMGSEAVAWMRHAGVGGCVAAAGALRLQNTDLPVNELPAGGLSASEITTTTTTKPDAFGIHSGPSTSTSPPV